MISLTYSASTVDASEGKAITAITPHHSPAGRDGRVHSKTIAPPTVWNLARKSGAISGTPTDAYVAEELYTVTATGTGDYTGSATAAITIAVGISRNIVVTETGKTNPAEDKRYHYVAVYPSGRWDNFYGAA